MLELHHAFLHLIELRDSTAVNQIATMEEATKSATDTIIKMIRGGSFNLNEQDEDGNTLLHLAVDESFTAYRPAHPIGNATLLQIIKEALQMGADPRIRNNKKLTPVTVNCANKNQYNPFSLNFFMLIQSYHPDDMSMIAFLNGFRADQFQQRAARQMCEYILFELKNKLDLDVLPLDTLKAILKWTDNIIKTGEMTTWPSALITQGPPTRLKEMIEEQIKLLEYAFDLPFIIHELISATGDNKNTFLRVMLLNNPPLNSMLNRISEEGLLSQLPDNQFNLFEKFITEFEHKRSILEELSSIPTPLTAKELNLVRPICNKLDAILYSLEPPNTDKEWSKRVKAIEDKEILQKRMVDTYAQYQAEDRLSRAKLLTEFHQHQEPIKNQQYLGKYGMYAKQNQRKKCAEAAERRLINN